MVVFCGCAAVLEGVPGFTHTAALIIGEKKGTIIANAQHILGSPKVNYIVAEGVPEPIEVVGYEYFSDKELYLCFYHNILFQAILMTPNSKEPLEFRPDYRSPRIGGEYPRGYLISRTNHTGTIKSIY